MDNKVLIRINSLLDHIDEVINDLKNISFSDFEKSSLLQRATSFSISQIGEMMNRLEEKLGEEYILILKLMTSIKLPKKIFRN